ncbi:MAG: PAS domain-containing sensor histidine kinase [Gammaproteobacteria bacterium]|nr:MAG: PAS domain-containing sensor histidine kinase [Gammaproteobacteria bacterium]
MHTKRSGQPSLLDASAIEAAAIYNTVLQEESKELFKSQPDYFLNENLEQIDSSDKASQTPILIDELFNVLPTAVVIVDGVGVVKQCSAVATSLLGGALTGKKWDDIVEREFLSQDNDNNDVSLRNDRLVHISIQLLSSNSGRIILLQDVTEIRQLQQKVSHLKRLSTMGEMAARLAHQIRTPLSSALLYLAPLMKPEGDEKLKQRFATRLHKSISHMENLVKDMLAFSRGDMAETSPIALNSLFLSVEQQFNLQPDADSFKLIIENNVDDGVVYGCENALSSAINNLMNNARLACDKQGEITLFADQINDDGIEYIEIGVEDNGVGIKEKDQGKILEPFFTTRSSGTGLGLAVVKSIVSAHKGELWFESVEGEGSTFCLRLPMYQPADKFMLKVQS